MMRRAGGILAFMLGALFLTSAILKAADATAFAVQMSYFGVVRDAAVVEFIAFAVIALEAALALLLLQRVALRKAALPLSFALLVAFTALLAWAWAFRDLENCGCFGKYLRMTPGEAIIKNLVLLGMTVAAWRLAPGAASAGGPRAAFRAPIWRIAVTVAGTAAIAGAAVLRIEDRTSANTEASGLPASGIARDKGRPFAVYALDTPEGLVSLGRGDHLIAMLSDTCIHCAEDVEALNAIHRIEELPPVAGLVLGDAAKLAEFREVYQPEFPTRIVPALEFFELIGDTPPRLYFTRNGSAIRMWDANIPDLEEVIEAVQIERRAEAMEGAPSP